MFDVSFWELLFIGLIALVVVGPERLPGVIRTVGLWVGRARAAVSSLRDEVEREVNAAGLRDTERSLRRDVEKGLREATKPLQDAGREIDDAGREAGRSVASSGSGSKANHADEAGPTEAPGADDAAAGDDSAGSARDTDKTS